KKRRVAQALSWVRLDHFATRRIDKLSGGERQRVAVARALVDGPACVLLDEPLAALDPHLRNSTLELLQEIQSRLRVTYIYVTHDRQEALRAAGRIGVLREGRLEQVGAPTELYRCPSSAFVASFLGPINWFEGLVQSGGSRSIRLRSGQHLPLDDHQSVETGRILLGVRPEDIVVGGEQFLAAEVLHQDFCGSTVTLRMASDEGVAINAELRGDSASPPVGARVSLSWPPNVAHVFPFDDVGPTT
ncbi:MAG TPA: ABC transporter ATP-binding protein, partial [Pirellulales bacterium]|nr:ABC transporter ATP-binding protein [Pirellulales bacterium]